MYGTVAKIQVKPGRDVELLELFDEWDRDLKPKVKGAMGGYTYRLDEDPNTFIMTAVFKDKATYDANADSPEQDKWYQRMRECLVADPEWNDGEIVRAF